MLPTPGFHHLHLNSVDPEAAIDFYTRLFPSTRKGEWGGIAALQSPNDVLVLFDKVAAPPPTRPQSAIWHFGWHVGDSQATARSFKTRPEAPIPPLCTSEEGGPGVNREGMFRTPRAGGEFGDVVLTWYMNQGNEALASSRGQLQDHIGLSVGDLDPWIEKLKGEGVTFLDGPYKLGDTRAVMI